MAGLGTECERLRVLRLLFQYHTPVFVVIVAFCDAAARNCTAQALKLSLYKEMVETLIYLFVCGCVYIYTYTYTYIHGYLHMCNTAQARKLPSTNR